MQFAVLIVSDSAHADNKLDKTGPTLVDLLNKSSTLGATITDFSIVPDEKIKIVEYLRKQSEKVDCILTSGGTGLSKRDVTPEATKEVIERECPGIVVAIIKKGLEQTPLAALTCQTAGVVGNCLIVNLPGSPKAVKEGFSVLEPILGHAVSLIKGDMAAISETHKQME